MRELSALVQTRKSPASDWQHGHQDLWRSARWTLGVLWDSGAEASRIGTARSPLSPATNNGVCTRVYPNIATGRRRRRQEEQKQDIVL